MRARGCAAEGRAVNSSQKKKAEKHKDINKITQESNNLRTLESYFSLAAPEASFWLVLSLIREQKQCELNLLFEVRDSRCLKCMACWRLKNSESDRFISLHTVWRQGARGRNN